MIAVRGLQPGMLTLDDSVGGLALISTVRIPITPERVVEIRNRLAQGGDIVALLRETHFVIGNDDEGYTIRENKDDPQKLFVTRELLDHLAEALVRHEHDDKLFAASLRYRRPFSRHDGS